MSDKPVVEFPVEPEEQPTLAGVSPPLDQVVYVLRQPGDCPRCGGTGRLLRAYPSCTGDELGAGPLTWRLEGCPECGGSGWRGKRRAPSP